MSTAAMKLAMGALEDLCDTAAEAWGEDRPCVEIARAAITALHTAIEAAEKQKPVGEVSGHDWSTGLLYRDLEPGTPLYTAPPRRPWVGLTDEQINQYDYQYRDLLYDAEKMLRENNA